MKFSVESSAAGNAAWTQDEEKRQQFEAVKRWFYQDWQRIDARLRTSIVEGISVFLSLFDDNPAVKRVFCPPKETYDPVANQDGRYGKPLPPFADLIETGAVCALNFPISANPGLAKAIGTMMKQDFQRAVLNRIPRIERQTDRHLARSVLPLRRIPGLRHGRRKRPERRREVLRPVAPSQMHLDRGHPEHQFSAVFVAG